MIEFDELENETRILVEEMRTKLVDQLGKQFQQPIDVICDMLRDTHISVIRRNKTVAERLATELSTLLGPYRGKESLSKAIKRLVVSHTKAIATIGGYTAKDGILFCYGKMLSVQNADDVANQFGFVHAEELVRLLEEK